MSFEWQTEDDHSWDEEPIVPEPQPPRRRWRFLFISLLGVAALFFLVRWQINQQVSEATGNVEVEILAAHNFILQTAVSQDNSLFSANISGRNLAWTETQKSLLADGLLLDRPMLGWQHIADAERLTLADVTIEIAPDLHGAELMYPQTYVVQTNAGVTETVQLQQTAVYRLGTNRWLYSPPDREFWGDWFTQGGDYLTMVYPERDRKVAVELAVRLDRLLGQMCAELADINCGNDFQVHLRLDPDPDALLASGDIAHVLDAGLQFELPTPTLIGLPMDDNGSEMLYRAYGVQLATAVLAHQIGYDCCPHQLFFRALRDYQLAEIGLQHWPLVPAMYQQNLDIGFDGDVTRHWSRRWEQAPPQLLQVWNIEDPDPIWQQVYMLVEFIGMQETAVSPIEMMRLMDRNSYVGWVAEVLQSDYEAPVFESSFLQYIQSQTIAGQQAEPSIPLPTGTISLFCQDFTNGPMSHIYSYDLAEKSWTEPFAGQFGESYVQSVNGDAFIIIEFEMSETETNYKIWLAKNDELRLIEETAVVSGEEYWISYSFVDVLAEYLMRFEYNAGETNMALLPTACVGGRCSSIPLEGNVEGNLTFSPNNEHLLLAEYPVDPAEFEPDVPFSLQSSLYLMSLEGQQSQLVGRGGLPFWLDESVYGYVQMGNDGWELVTAVSTENVPRFLLSQNELLAEIRPENRPTGLFPRQAITNPANPQEMIVQFIHAEDIDEYGLNTRVYLFKLTLRSDLSGVESIDWVREDFLGGVVGFSANGRHIIHGEYGTQNSNSTWHFLNKETGQSEHAFNSTHSLAGTDDGEWYVQLAENFIMLHAPLQNYQHFIPHSFEECQQAALSLHE